MRNPISLWNRSDDQSFMSPFFELQRNIDRLFEDFLSPASESEAGDQERLLIPAIDFEEAENQYVLKVDMPGVKREDIKVELLGNQLRISGSRKDERKSSDNERRVVERSYGTFQRVISLPSSVQAEQVSADYQNGELVVMVPKAEEAKPRQIQLGQKQEQGAQSKKGAA